MGRPNDPIKERGNSNKPINMVNMYHPPNDLLDSYNEFIKELTPVISTFQNNNNEIIVAGDFNINLLQINDRHIVGEYFDMFTSHSVYPIVSLPTRLSNNHATLIDNFFCKLTETTMLDTPSGILIKTFSDHQPYFILLNNIKHKTHKPKYIKLSQQYTERIE